jgi:predicted transcriptional regulator
MNSVFKPWEQVCFQALWVQGEASSREVYEYVHKGISVSRASVINFLNDMVERGFIDYREVTGKGGYKRIYKTNALSGDYSELQRTICDLVLMHLRNHLGGDKFGVDITEVSESE